MSIDYKSIADTDWARLAAYIDGEGCLFIDFRRSIKTGIGNITNQSRASIIVVNNDYRLPLWLNKVFGGSVLTRKLPPIEGRNRGEHYSWSAGHKALPEILSRIIPWLVIKKEQAEVLLDFVRTFEPKRGRYYRTSDSVLDIREALSRKSQLLKKNPMQMVRGA
jgi:hypothetical protein